jgi:dipeptidyl aminopeptidase/acylaminoacyl peptidase
MTMRSLLASCVLVVSLTVPVARGAENTDELTFDDLFRRQAISAVSLSPDGEFIAFFRWNTLVIGKPQAAFSDVREFAGRLSIQEITWIGPDALWIRSWDGDNQRHLHTAIRFEYLDEGGYGVAAVEDHRDAGLMIDPDVDNGNRVVLSIPRWQDDTLKADLYSVDAFKQLGIQLNAENRVETGTDEFFYYEQDSNGEFTLGIRIAEGTPEIWSRSTDTKEWTHVWTASRESAFIPVGISQDSKTLWVLTDAQTDLMVAAEFDLETNSFGEILFEHDRVDVNTIVMSPDGTKPIGATYTERGLVQYHFFAEEFDFEFEAIRTHFPGEGIVRIGYSPVSGRQLVFASSPVARGKIHVCDAQEDWCELVESVAPWLDGKKLNETVVLDAKSTDEVVVEAFLTLPASGGDSIPLVAMPHGGPIGISDNRYFSGEVQWLAHNGYAVLQINYRGSGGYGDNFKKAGLRQWGRGIEDDIEAAVYKVLEDYPVIDSDRVGIFGASYGGYSAMMSVIRNPGLFKCAASFAGVMDLTLLFTESTTRRNDYLRDLLIEYVGDPNVDYAEQIVHSPVYRYKDISRPVLLGHGLVDSVADFEHSWRMQKMLRLKGTPAQLVLLKNVGHGFEYIDEARDFYTPLLEFLNRYLMAGD